jgi:hypothetical protein
VFHWNPILTLPPPIADDDQGQKTATSSAPHLIPTTKKQGKSSVVNLHTNGLDSPKFNLLHKAQQPVSADAPGFREAMDGFVVPPQLMHLYQNCLAKPKDSFFISASVHIQVISHACGLTTKDMLKMRGWIFLKKKSLGGSLCRHESFSDSVYKTTKLGAKNPNNPRYLVHRFDEVLRKMRLEHADLTSNFPSPLVVASRKTSKKKGKEGEPLTKHLRGVSIEEKDLLAADKHSVKIRNYFKKHHLGVGTVYSIFSDCVEREYDLYFPLCDSLFKTCMTETGYVSVLHNALRVFYGVCSTSEDGIQSKKTWIDHPELFMEQVQLKFGKPGVCPSEVCEEAVASNFEQLMNDNEKKTGGVCMAPDNAVLIRFRVLCLLSRNERTVLRLTN